MTETSDVASRPATGRGVSSRGPMAVGVVPLLTRTVGILLWRVAEPESLPVPALEPLPGDRSARATPARAAGGSAAASDRSVAAAIRASATVAAILGLVLTVVGGIATLSMRRLADDLAATAPGTPLDETAARLESAATGRWWMIASPSSGERLGRAARAVREGHEALASLASAYDASRSQMAASGPVGRLLRGAEFAAPVVDARDRVGWPWHRGTLAFREIQEAIEPYAAANATPIARFRGAVVGAPIGHALGVSLARDASADRDGGPGGERASAGRPIEAGGRFDLPFDPDARVRVSDWMRPRPGDALAFVEEREMPLADWPDGEIVFPREGSTFVVRLDDEWAKRAPALPALSDAARREIGVAAPGGEPDPAATRGR